MNQSPTYHPTLWSIMARLKAKDKPEKRRNKLKQGRRRWAQQRKEAWVRYELDMAEYNRKKSEQEAEERRASRMHNSSYDKI
jgi:hypothetical protein